jgi:hypothetical protein
MFREVGVRFRGLDRRTNNVSTPTTNNGAKTVRRKDGEYALGRRIQNFKIQILDWYELLC